MLYGASVSFCLLVIAALLVLCGASVSLHLLSLLVLVLVLYYICRDSNFFPTAPNSKASKFYSAYLCLSGK
jgi:hypothetical protein